MAEPFDLLYGTPEMVEAFSAQAFIQGMLTFEAALAQAEAQAGIIPPEAANSIAASCQAERFDATKLFHDAATAGTPAIPLVRMLTAQVGDEAGKYVHWGATSQDAIDSALMLQMHAGLDLLIQDLLNLCGACSKLAEEHRQTLMIGRTLLQQALPITFGLKAARWLSMSTRQLQALRSLQKQALAIQLGGAAGTLAALGDAGPRVLELLSSELDLPAPDLPWHTERDRVAEIASTLGVLAGTLAKIAEDIVLLAQTELGEVSEEQAEGKGGSSAMPQKHNPVDATAALACSRLAIGMVPVLLSAMVQEHERAVGGWQAEWNALPKLFCYTAGALRHVHNAVAGLQIDAPHMLKNLKLTKGLIMAESLTMALAPHVGRPKAQRLVQKLCEQAAQSREELSHVAQRDQEINTRLSAEEVEHALNPALYLGSTDIFIERALNTYHKTRTPP